MRNEARKEMSQEKNSLGKTGGEKPPELLKAFSKHVIEIFRDKPSFSRSRVN